MSIAYFQGLRRPVDIASRVPRSDFEVARLSRANANPIYTRFRNVRVNGYTIRLPGEGRRPRSTRVGAAGIPAGAANAIATIPLANVGFLQNGDVMEVVSTGEFLEITDHPNAAANTVQVRRGVSGTPTGAAAADVTVKLIGNSRTGAETFQKSYSVIPGYSEQFIQTFQFVYETSGGEQAVRPDFLRAATPYAGEKQGKFEDIQDDIEYAALYGRPENYGGVAARMKMAGLFAQIITNNETGPANATAFKPSDLNDVLFAPLVGKDPDTLLVSPGWFAGLAVWGMQPQMLQAGETKFGVAIETWVLPFFPRVSIVMIPAMEGISAILCRRQDIVWANLDPLHSVEHGINGDAMSGHWITRTAIVLEDETRAAAVRNIEAFAPQNAAA